MRRVMQRNRGKVILLISIGFWLMVGLICYSLIQDGEVTVDRKIEQTSTFAIITQTALVVWAVLRGIDLLFFYLLKLGRKLFSALNEWLGVTDQKFIVDVLDSFPRYIYRKLFNRGCDHA
jgi:hypothetical protein